MRQRISVFMGEIREAYPAARLVWSDILPRACYFGAKNPAKMETKRRAVDRWARSLRRRLAVSVLQHPQFAWLKFDLFRYVGVHLSSAGNSAFRFNIRDCINAVV